MFGLKQKVKMWRESWVAGIYNRSTYAPEKRAALELWASQLAVAIAQANGANVVRLKGRPGGGDALNRARLHANGLVTRMCNQGAIVRDINSLSSQGRFRHLLAGSGRML